jgi:hypothetical protein
MERKYKVKLSSVEKIEDLLQEIYDQACKQIIEIQNEMNKLVNSTNLADISIDEKAKYAKAIHDFVGDKSRAVAAKFEIAKFMGEILKHNGDINGALNDPNFKQNTKLDWKTLRDEINSSSSGTDTYTLKN